VDLEWIGLIPAAGKGIRLGLPYPKELYPIIRHDRYKPVSQFIVDQMLTAAVTHIVFVINETKHQLIGYFGNGSRFNCHFSYVVQEHAEMTSSSTSPGLAYALDSAFHLTRRKLVFFGMADTIIQPNGIFLEGLTKIEEFEVVLCLISTNSPSKFGMVNYSSDGNVVEIIDKPTTTSLTHMWACMLWKPIFTEYLHEQILKENNGDFAKIMNCAMNDGVSFGSVVIENGNYIDLGTYDELMELDKRLREGNE
jgi:glucose-1-phosphate thymidylyltransferase